MLKLYIIIFVLVTVNLNSKTYDSWLNIDNKYSNRFPVERANNGAFIEFLMDWINGPTGFWSQELIDRGFDDNECDGKLCNWVYINSNSNIDLSNDMYNENGVFGVHIKGETMEFTGLEQEFFYDDTTKLDIYIYAKSIENSSQLTIQLLNLDGSVLQEKSFNITNEFIKYEFQSEVFIGNEKLKIRFGTKEINELVIDEASVMPNNNINGIRKEIFDIFKEWKPGILRYPGGWFADLEFNKLENAIGPIDKRTSPQKHLGFFQRMDMGYDEYFKFIEALNIQPHIVVNFIEGTDDDAANIVEYLNSNSDTEYGKKRKENGRETPYNVEWFEVGNEQWNDVVNYSIKLKSFYNKMKSVDKSIKIISNGDIWQGLDHFKAMDSIANGSFDLYGYHPIMGMDTTEINSNNDSIKYGYLGTMHYYESYITELNKLKESRGNKCFIGNTEWSHFIDNVFPQFYDTTNYSSQFQTGLFNALITNYAIRNSDFHKMSEKTVSIGSIQRNFIGNKRQIFKKPAIVTGAMFGNHLGEYVIKLDAEKNYSPLYSIYGPAGFWCYDVPFVDYTVTASEDTTFVYVINRNLYDSVKVNLNSNLKYSSNSAKVYTYYQGSLEAMLLPNDIHSFDPIESIISIKESYSFPPHSFSILALPTTETLTFSKDEENLISQYVTNGILETNIKEKVNSIEIYNIIGEKVENYNISQVQPLLIDMSYISRGIYFIKIVSITQTYQGKFIKN